MAWLDIGVAKMNDLIRYTDIAILAADTVAFCCLSTQSRCTSKYKIVEFQEDYEGRCTMEKFFSFQTRNGQSAEEL
jgi:hypothetical protein